MYVPNDPGHERPETQKKLCYYADFKTELVDLVNKYEPHIGSEMCWKALLGLIKQFMSFGLGKLT